MADESFFERMWTNYDEFQEDFKQYCSATRQVFSVIDSRTVATQNSKLREGKQCTVISFCIYA